MGRVEDGTLVAKISQVQYFEQGQYVDMETVKEGVRGSITDRALQYRGRVHV